MAAPYGTCKTARTRPLAWLGMEDAHGDVAKAECFALPLQEARPTTGSRAQNAPLRMSRGLHDKLSAAVSPRRTATVMTGRSPES